MQRTGRRWRQRSAMRPVSRGFTLLEILVVIVIIAILTAMLVPNLVSGGHWRQIAREADILAARVRVAQDDAMMYGREYGIVFRDDGYSFVAWDAGARIFRLPPDTAPWMERQVEEGIRLLAAADDGNPILVLPEKPADQEAAAGEGAAASGGQGDSGKTPQPSVYLLSSGEVTPFTAVFRAEEEENEGRLVIDAFGNRVAVEGHPGD